MTEIVIIFAGILGVVQQVALSLILAIACMANEFAKGTMDPMSLVMSEAFNTQDERIGMKALKFLNLIVSFLFISISALLYQYRSNLIHLLTSD